MLFPWLLLSVAAWPSVVAGQGQDCPCASDVAAVEVAHSLTYYKVITTHITTTCVPRECVYKFIFKGAMDKEPVWRVTLTRSEGWGSSSSVKLYNGLSEDSAALFYNLTSSNCEGLYGNLSSLRTLTVVTNLIKDTVDVHVSLVVQPVIPNAHVTPTPFQPDQLQMDLAFVIDATVPSRNDVGDFELMRNFTVDVVKNFSVHTDITQNTGVRLALHWLSYKPQGNIGGAYWTQTREMFTNAVKAYMPFYASSSLYVTALMNLLNNAFNVDTGFRSRKDAERVLVVLTSRDSGDRGDLTNLLLSMDVHPVIVNFANDSWTPSPSNISAMLGGTNEARIFNFHEHPQNPAKHFVEDVLGNGAFLCPLVKCNNSMVNRTISTAHFHDLSSGFRNDGKSGRYCNFHSETDTVIRNEQEANAGKKYLSIWVQYELESDKDFLAIVDSKGTEQAFFSGYDVEGSRICFEETSQAKVHFSSDNEFIYGGFYLVASFVSDCNV